MIAFLHLEDYLDRTLAELAADMRKTLKTRVGDATLRELAGTLERPNGVYAFYDKAEGGTCLYVGKVSSQSYIARIAMHFDPREKSWMNQFVVKLRDSDFKSQYERAHFYALEQYIVFVGLLLSECSQQQKKKIRSQRIGTLESVLRTYLVPRLNLKRGEVDGSHRLSELLPTEVV